MSAVLHVHSVPFLVSAVTAALQPPHPSLKRRRVQPNVPPSAHLTHSRLPPTPIYRRPSPRSLMSVSVSLSRPARRLSASAIHVSPTTRYALPTCLTVRASFPAIHTILPLRLMRTPSSTCTLFPLCISHHLPHITSAFTLTGRAPLRTSVLYFLSAPVFPLPPRRPYRAPRCCVCTCVFHYPSPPCPRYYRTRPRSV